MTWNPPRTATAITNQIPALGLALGLALALALVLLSPARANEAEEPYLPETVTVPLDPSDPDRTTIGELTYLGGVEILPGKANLGGISGLEWHQGQLFSVADDGHWIIITPDHIQQRLTDVIEIEIGDLSDERGKPLRGNDASDAEAIARGTDGSWLIAFEREHRVWQYSLLTAQPQSSSIDPGALSLEPGSNEGLETLAASPHGWLACAERSAANGPNCLRKTEAGVAPISIATPEALAAQGGVPTDASCASNGVCFILFRSYIPGIGNGVAIHAIGPDGKGETLASWNTDLTIDNFEGLAVREDDERTYIYIISDNNFSGDQRTLLMKFEVSQRAATAPGVPPKVYETVNVVMETSLGDIIVALETERAPITAANFLRYVDEGRFKDTRCYRAMQVEGREEPSGFVQCGTQNRPDRILAPIVHEPTSVTGLSHFDGALSMARFEPGTATGDFSIMIQDQRGLDADPSNADPGRHAGFAVFGYVIGGMDTVIEIQAQPVDPDKGEGFLKGQMLAEPIVISNIRRVQP